MVPRRDQAVMPAEPGAGRGRACAQYSRAERVADAVVHLLGAVLALLACGALAVVALPSADLRRLASLAVYAAGLVAMLGCSTLYHMTSGRAWRSVFRRLDHAAIFLMIAGTYTPFALFALDGAWGIGLLMFVWLIAAGGALCNLIMPLRFVGGWSIAVYLLLGWTALVAIEPLVAALSLPGILLLALGGLLYTSGVVFHLWRRLPYHQAIWHSFVLAAAACHYTVILSEVALAG